MKQINELVKFVSLIARWVFSWNLEQKIVVVLFLFFTLQNGFWPWIIIALQGTADEVVHCSHGEQLWELCKQKYDPVWINGGGHSNLELYPEYIKQLRKFVLSLSKVRANTDGSKKNTTTTSDSDNQSKPPDGGASDTFELAPDHPEVSRKSLDSRLEKSKKSTKQEKSRVSIDQVDRFRRKKGLVW